MGAKNIFLQLDGIKGEAEDEKHKGWIAIQSFSTGASNSTEVTHVAKSKSGSAFFQGFNMTMDMDASVVKIMESCLTGTVIKKAIIDICGNDGKSQLTYTLDSVLISTLDLGSQGTSTSVSMGVEYVNVKVEIFAADGKAAGSVGFNRALNMIAK